MKEEELSKGFNETSSETYSTTEWWEPRIEALPKKADRLTAWSIILALKKLRKNVKNFRSRV